MAEDTYGAVLVMRRKNSPLLYKSRFGYYGLRTRPTFEQFVGTVRKALCGSLSQTMGQHGTRLVLTRVCALMRRREAMSARWKPRLSGTWRRTSGGGHSCRALEGNNCWQIWYISDSSATARRIGGCSRGYGVRPPVKDERGATSVSLILPQPLNSHGRCRSRRTDGGQPCPTKPGSQGRNL